MMPTSSKTVVLDVRLPVRSAFQALAENEQNSGPLWDPLRQDYIGFLTVTDFIQILLHFDVQTDAANTFRRLGEHSIKSWRNWTMEHPKRPAMLIYGDPDDTLWDCANTITHYGSKCPLHAFSVFLFSTSFLFISPAPSSPAPSPTSAHEPQSTACPSLIGRRPIAFS